MPLVYRDRGEAKSGTQLDVMSGIVVVCSLRKNSLSGLAKIERWNWSWRIKTEQPPGWAIHGSADTKAQATEFIERQWQEWLSAAGL
jgi:hypothetical protein